MLLPVTLCSAAAAAILTIWLMLRIGSVRRSTQISEGHGDHTGLMMRMRAQSNFVESVPFVLVLIAAIELSGRGQPWLAYIAGIYFLGRIAHALGMDPDGFGKGRMIGTIVTALTLLVLAVVAVLITLGVM